MKTEGCLVTLESDVCPYLDIYDIRCETHLSLSHINDAFGHCIGNYYNCPIYHTLREELNYANQKKRNQLSIST